MPRITNRIALASMINVVREHYYRSTINSTPCRSATDVERLCQQLSALAITFRRNASLAHGTPVFPAPNARNSFFPTLPFQAVDPPRRPSKH